MTRLTVDGSRLIGRLRELGAVGRDGSDRLIRLTSGAGHDAQTIARTCPAAMIFVPSRDGVSHNPAEHTEEALLVAVADVLLDVVSVIAGKDEGIGP